MPIVNTQPTPVAAIMTKYSYLYYLYFIGKLYLHTILVITQPYTKIYGPMPLRLKQKWKVQWHDFLMFYWTRTYVTIPIKTYDTIQIKII